MNADHAAQLRLLDLQADDTALAQLAHRRRTLPELAALAERDERATALTDEIIDAETRATDVADEQRRLENEVDAVRSRAVRDEQRMQAGGLPSKELEQLQHEVASLARRQSSLEDDLLEVMEQREQADATLADLVSQRTVLDGERAELTTARDTAFAEIDETVVCTHDRARGARSRPADRSARPLRAGTRARRWCRRGDAPAAPLRGLPYRAVRQRAVRGARRGAGRGHALRELPSHPGPHRRIRPVSPSLAAVGRS